MSALENRARGTDILAGSGILTGISPDVGERKQEINLYIKRLRFAETVARNVTRVLPAYRFAAEIFCGVLPLVSGREEIIAARYAGLPRLDR